MAEIVIDQIVEEQKGDVILFLRQIEPWDKSETLMEFQKRLNGYIDAITQGFLYQKYPDLIRRPIRIRLLCYYEPSSNVRGKLDRATQTLAGLGIGFEIVHIKVDTEPSDKLKAGLSSFFRKLRRKN
jgi:hypothetical protein